MKIARDRIAKMLKILKAAAQNWALLTSIFQQWRKKDIKTIMNNNLKM